MLNGGNGTYGSLGGNQPSRDLAKAKEAYTLHDAEASRLAHQSHMLGNQATEGHRQYGDYIKSIVYGGVDGVLTCFAIVSGSHGGSLPPTTILILGISNIVADAFAMGVGDAISTLAYNEHVIQERARESWELENYPEGEIEEMIELYEQRDLPREKAELVVKTMAKYREFFIDIMMCEELGLKVPGKEEWWEPYKSGFVTFLSFLIFGATPLFGYVLVPLIDPEATPETLFIMAFVVTMIVLFLLGAFKSQFASSPWWKSGLEILILGTLAASTSYFIGGIVKDIADDYFGDSNAIPGPLTI